MPSAEYRARRSGQPGPRHALTTRRFAALVASAAGVTLGWAVLAAPSLAASAGSPNLSAMTLQLPDLPQGSAILQSGKAPSDGALAAYSRSFEILGRKGPAFVNSTVELESNAEYASLVFADIRRGVNSAAFHHILASEFISRIPRRDHITTRDVTIGRSRSLKAGAGAIYLPLTLRAQHRTISAVFSFMLVDRTIGDIFGVRDPGGRLPAIGGLDDAMTAHMLAGLIPAASAPPAVAGTATVGQTLTATPGTWSDSPTLAYQWQMCDATGANCADVAGATGPTYDVPVGNVGSTLRVLVTATTSAGVATAPSTVTAVVTS